MAESSNSELVSSPKCDTSGPKVRQFPTTFAKLTYVGAVWKVDDSFTPSAVAAKWSQVASFENAEHPINSEDVDMQVS
jgi:hypothetical protein